jgi:hypothetical protein
MKGESLQGLRVCLLGQMRHSSKINKSWHFAYSFILILPNMCTLPGLTFIGPAWLLQVNRFQVNHTLAATKIFAVPGFWSRMLCFVVRSPYHCANETDKCGRRLKTNKQTNKQTKTKNKNISIEFFISQRLGKNRGKMTETSRLSFVSFKIRIHVWIELSRKK